MLAIGPKIRRLFGPYERAVAEAYRGIYLDLNGFASCAQSWAPEAKRILEVGCGEGAVTERLSAFFPSANITAIDITSTVGRLFKDPPDRVTFIQTSIHGLIDVMPNSFDLVVLCDVLHHVPLSERNALLRGIHEVMEPGARFILKDWAPSFHPIHWAAAFSDHYVTGDAVQFYTKDRIAALLIEVFGPGAIRGEARIAPWANNVAFLVTRQACRV